MKNLIIRFSGVIVIGIALTMVFNLWLCPTVGFTPSFLGVLLLAFGIASGIMSIVAAYMCEDAWESLITLVPIVCLLIGWIVSWDCWDTNAFRDAIAVVEKEKEAVYTDLPTEEDIANISLMDTATAKKLGDRVLGTIPEYVSQYVADNYYTICVNGETFKVAPMEYARVDKAWTNDSIPGYVIVNPKTQDAEVVKLEEGFIYSPSAIFGEDLTRLVQKNYPCEYRGDLTFQIDDDNNIWWVQVLEKANNFWNCRVPYAVVLINPYTGETEKFLLDEVPEWVDLVFGGDKIESLYNKYGKYVDGWWNGYFGQKLVTATTDDFGYISKDNTMYVYTGITSVAKDESNLGFVLVSTKTGIYYYYEVPGAEEYSAMNQAETLVQNFGYKASFPSLVLVNKVPTYVMVLKGANDTVQQYAMVNMSKYTVAAVGNTLAECLRAYQKALMADGTSGDLIQLDNVVEETIVVSDILYIVEGGETTVYIKAENGKVFKSNFEEYFVLISVGDTITVVYEKSNDTILTMVEVR